jgi:hypothetical protein
MTTTTTALCGYRWPGGLHVNDLLLPILRHRCDRAADHQTDPDLISHRAHRCRCGATTDGSTR